MAIGDIRKAILNYEIDRVSDLVRAELEAKTELSQILNEGLIAPMDEVGKLFSEGQLFIPEMLLTAKVMKTGLEVLKPLLTQGNVKPRGAVIIGTVRGDLHDIGKNLVGMMVER